MAKITHVVGPKFFGYANAIAINLDAEYINELFTDNFIIKILIRLRLGFLFKFIQNKYYSRLSSKLRKLDTASVLFVDIEFVPLYFLKELENCGIQYRIYLWDSVKNKPVFNKYLNFNINYCSTFDYLDSINLGIPLINLFSEDVFRDLRGLRIEKGVFVGTLHSVRPKYIKLFIDAGFKFDFENCHFYYYNPLLAIIRSIFDADFRYFYLKGLIKYNSISKEEINIRFNKCKWVFDIAHIGQSGLTSRTFEALSSGSIVYSNNKYSSEILKNFTDRILVYDIENLVDFYTISNNYGDVINNQDISTLGIDYFCSQLNSLFNEN